MYKTFSNSPQDDKHYITFTCYQNNKNLDIIYETLFSHDNGNS